MNKNSNWIRAVAGMFFSAGLSTKDPVKINLKTEEGKLNI